MTGDDFSDDVEAQAQPLAAPAPRGVALPNFSTAERVKHDLLKIFGDWPPVIVNREHHLSAFVAQQDLDGVSFPSSPALK